MKPPVNPTYAAQLRLLSTLPINQRLNYLKAGLLRTGANVLQAKSNLFGRNSNNLNNAANDLYPPPNSRPPPPPPTPRPTGIRPRDPFSLNPGTVEDIDTELLRLVDPPDENSKLTFGGLQNMIHQQRLLSQRQRLRAINREPAQQGEISNF